MCHMCMQIPCTLRSQSVIPNQNLVAGFKPKGKHNIQNRETRQETDKQIFSKLLPMTTWCCEGMVWQYHNSKVNGGQKECTGPLLETPTHLCSLLLVSPVLLPWHLSKTAPGQKEKEKSHLGAYLLSH